MGNACRKKPKMQNHYDGDEDLPEYIDDYEDDDDEQYSNFQLTATNSGESNKRLKKISTLLSLNSGRSSSQSRSSPTFQKQTSVQSDQGIMFGGSANRRGSINQATPKTATSLVSTSTTEQKKK